MLSQRGEKKKILYVGYYVGSEGGTNQLKNKKKLHVKRKKQIQRESRSISF